MYYVRELFNPNKSHFLLEMNRTIINKNDMRNKPTNLDIFLSRTNHIRLDLE